MGIRVSIINSAIGLGCLAALAWAVTAEADLPRQQEPTAPTEVAGSWAQTYRNPKGGEEKIIVAEITRAKRWIKIQADDCAPCIRLALKLAQRRGVRLTAIVHGVPAASGHTSLAEFLKQAGGRVYVSGQPRQLCCNAIIIDGQTVIAGSLDFAASSGKPDQNELLILRSKAMAKMYGYQWQGHLKHAQEF